MARVGQETRRTSRIPAVAFPRSPGAGMGLIEEIGRLQKYQPSSLLSSDLEEEIRISTYKVNYDKTCVVWGSTPDG